MAVKPSLGRIVIVTDEDGRQLPAVVKRTLTSHCGNPYDIERELRHVMDPWGNQVSAYFEDPRTGGPDPMRCDVTVFDLTHEVSLFNVPFSATPGTRQTWSWPVREE